MVSFSKTENEYRNRCYGSEDFYTEGPIADRGAPNQYSNRADENFPLQLNIQNYIYKTHIVRQQFIRNWVNSKPHIKVQPLIINIK